MKRLSKNEKIALELAAKGLKNREIAKIMTDRNGNPLSEKTVSTYIRRVRSKLEVSLDKNTYFLVKAAIMKEIIEEPTLDGID
ncbi:helix-turn-helix domain-containing protein [Hyunsoonleella sp. 2307UL5-6]|uniref:helix-turn-helix domain-containing protein n=1 Tax=Hyunsoonleella sp. 2307UL5-6 TaxID=3384768 RepID=UPI0039BC6ADC